MSSCRASNGDTWEIYGGGTDWRWRRTSSNGRIVGASSESYTSKAHCIENARRNGMDCTPA